MFKPLVLVLHLSVCLGVESGAQALLNSKVVAQLPLEVASKD